ncbi:MAG: type II CRISPR-associated endonuclease Cas1 [Bacteroidales bacterium]|nr:type II CRISPR-associated endonuclease Cas1 [Lentimicrobiaceae bacterium]MDD5694300.1 type II CRISPR-associated endonuclease Cas1 [Bacteroidales bacterium]
MIKRTLYFGKPAYLSKTNKQMIVRLPEVEKNVSLPGGFKKEATATIPIEDVGVVILDNQHIIVSQALISALLDNNVALISCNESHLPSGLMLPLDVHHIQHERFLSQINASEPLKKQLWQQTVKAKILNQAFLLRKIGKSNDKLMTLSKRVKSGDPENQEGRAALYYWDNLFPSDIHFSRSREGNPPNNLLNYGYAILRAIVARNLIGSGLLPTLGIHHSNKYNAYCLADDIMEPYRPFVDNIVYQIVVDNIDYQDLTTELKRSLLDISSIDVQFNDERSPLMIGMQRTTASLAKCFEGNGRKISYPSF